MNEAVLTRLLRGEHLSMPERIELGVWPHPPIPMEVLIQTLTKALQENECFPKPCTPTHRGERIDEQGTIKHISDNRFVYRATRAQPWDPTAAADSIERCFGTAREAAEFYLRWDLHVPGDLDGWKVI